MLMHGINKEAHSAPNRTLIVIIYNTAARMQPEFYIPIYHLLPAVGPVGWRRTKIRNGREFIVMKGWRFIRRYCFTNDPISWPALLVLIMVNSCKQDLPDTGQFRPPRHYTVGIT